MEAMFFLQGGRETFIFEENKIITMKLDVVLEKDETGYYVAEVPALPGCFSQGKTLAEVTQNIKEAIEGWLEVMNEKSRGKKTKNTRSKRIAVNV
jgi:predicted RNase H-like HicB family nuclease